MSTAPLLGSALLLTLAAAASAGDCTVYSLVKNGTCAQSCLGDHVGICPVSLVAKMGHLQQGKACAGQGYATPNGTRSQKAGPCGTITFDLFTKGTAPVAAAAAGGAPITLYAFDRKSPGVTWEVVDDPVMGGQSKSQLTMDATNECARWHGQVKIVPFLKSPGFCTFRSNQFDFPDVAGTKAIHLRIRNNCTGGLSRFAVQLETKGGRSGFKQGTYSGNISVPVSSQFVDVSASWDDFDLTWRGQRISGPKLTDQLDQIETLGLSTFFPGTVGKFDLEVQSITAE